MKPDESTEFMQIKAEIEDLSDQISVIQRKKTKLNERLAGTKERDYGVARYETMIREIKEYGENAGKPGRLGEFVKFYAKFASGRVSEWVIVKLVKKNGEVGLREATFYKWEKES